MISLVSVEVRLSEIAEGVRAAANSRHIETLCSQLQKDLRRASQAIYRDHQKGVKRDTRIGARPVYVQDHQHFAEIEGYLADAMREFHLGDVEAAIAALECARSICRANTTP